MYPIDNLIYQNDLFKNVFIKIANHGFAIFIKIQFNPCFSIKI